MLRLGQYARIQRVNADKPRLKILQTATGTRRRARDGRLNSVRNINGTGTQAGLRKAGKQSSGVHETWLLPTALCGQRCPRITLAAIKGWHAAHVTRKVHQGQRVCGNTGNPAANTQSRLQKLDAIRRHPRAAPPTWKSTVNASQC